MCPYLKMDPCHSLNGVKVENVESKWIKKMIISCETNIFFKVKVKESFEKPKHGNIN